jgi:hypothetical protein
MVQWSILQPVITEYVPDLLYASFSHGIIGCIRAREPSVIHFRNGFSTVTNMDLHGGSYVLFFIAFALILNTLLKREREKEHVGSS